LNPHADERMQIKSIWEQRAEKTEPTDRKESDKENWKMSFIICTLRQILLQSSNHGILDGQGM
jgi:hypothetical protein